MLQNIKVQNKHTFIFHYDVGGCSIYNNPCLIHYVLNGGVSKYSVKKPTSTMFVFLQPINLRFVYRTVYRFKFNTVLEKKKGNTFNKTFRKRMQKCLSVFSRCRCCQGERVIISKQVKVLFQNINRQIVYKTLQQYYKHQTTELLYVL